MTKAQPTIITKERVDQKVVVQLLLRKRKGKNGRIVNDKSRAFTVENIDLDTAYDKALAAFGKKD